MKRLAFPLMLAVALIAPTGARADEAIVVGLDEIGDWGSNVDTTLGPIGHELGMDLMFAAIGNDTPGVIDFVIGLTNLPENGGTPEFARYLWDMTVNGKHVDLDGKFTNYHRGACDPTSGQCPPARDPGPAPFVVHGNCDTSSGAATLCEELGIVQARFDPGAATITIPVPLAMLGESGCAEILPAVSSASFPGGSIVAVPSVFFSQSLMPLDYLVLDDEVEIVVC